MFFVSWILNHLCQHPNFIEGIVCVCVCFEEQIEQNKSLDISTGKCCGLPGEHYL